MIDWKKIDTKSVLSKKFRSLEITSKEEELLDDMPQEIWDAVMEIVGQYNPLDTPYNIRDAIILKSLAILLSDLDEVKRAITMGYSS
jgi:hypothetical protein